MTHIVERRSMMSRSDIASSLVEGVRARAEQFSSRRMFPAELKAPSESSVADTAAAEFMRNHEAMKLRIPDLERQVARHIVSLGIAEGKIEYLEKELTACRRRAETAESVYQTLALQIGNVAQPLMTALETTRKELLRRGLLPTPPDRNQVEEGVAEIAQRFAPRREDDRQELPEVGIAST